MLIASWNILEHLRAVGCHFCVLYKMSQLTASFYVIGASWSCSNFLYAVPRKTVRPAGFLEGNRDWWGDSDWLLCRMPHSLCGGWVTLRLCQQRDYLLKVMACSFWRDTMLNAKPVSHFSLDNSCKQKKKSVPNSSLGHTFLCRSQKSYTSSINLYWICQGHTSCMGEQCFFNKSACWIPEDITVQQGNNNNNHHHPHHKQLDTIGGTHNIIRGIWWSIWYSPIIDWKWHLWLRLLDASCSKIDFDCL